MFNPRTVSSILSIFLLLLCTSGILKFQFIKLTILTQNLQSKEEIFNATEQAKFSLNLMKQVPTFGFSNLIADYFFLQFIQYFGDDEARNKTDYSLNPEYFEVVVNQDPRFVASYLYLSPATSLYSGRPDQTVTLMERGLTSLSPYLPNAYYVWLYKATDELLFLGRGSAAQQSFQTAAQWAELDNTPESQQVAASARRTAQFLAHNRVSKTAQISSWLMILANAENDKRIQQLVIDRVQALDAKLVITTQGQLKIEMPQED